MKNIIVIGAGPAGLLAAATAALNGASVKLLERNPRPARKLMITGKGRCNVTNACGLQDLIANVPKNGRFLYSSFSNFMPDDICALLEAEGVQTKVERGNRVFPVSDKAVDVVDALVSYAKKAGVSFVQAYVTELLLKEDTCIGVKCEDGAIYTADAVAVCTGGLSYPKTGSTGDGFRFARDVGLQVVAPTPSLVPLCIREYDCCEMQGLSLKNVSLSALDTVRNKVVFEEMGEMMFTHFGVTGPLVLSASAHLHDMVSGRYQLLLDMKPALSEQQLSDRLLRELEQHKNASVQTMLASLLPKSMIPVMASRCGLTLRIPCNAVTKEQRLRLLTTLKKFKMTVDGFRPIDEAIVTAGGVSIKEIDAKTMACKKIKGLYFAGEVLDVDAYTGGFNLQIAYSTGVAAGRAMASITE